MEDIEKQLKQEAINFVDWLWKNVDEKIMSQHDWDYWYDYWKKEVSGV